MHVSPAGPAPGVVAVMLVIVAFHATRSAPDHVVAVLLEIGALCHVIAA